LAAGCLVIITAGVGSSASTPASFDQRKAEQLRRIDNRIKQLEDEKTCISAATSREDMKTCHQQVKPVQKSGRL
jgi:hypothetical protein